MTSNSGARETLYTLVHRPCLTERLLMGRKESYQTKKHPCAHELHMRCTTGELALSDE